MFLSVTHLLPSSATGDRRVYGGRYGARPSHALRSPGSAPAVFFFFLSYMDISRQSKKNKRSKRFSLSLLLVCFFCVICWLKPNLLTVVVTHTHTTTTTGGQKKKKKKPTAECFLPLLCVNNKLILPWMNHVQFCLQFSGFSVTLINARILLFYLLERCEKSQSSPGLHVPIISDIV